MTEKEHDNLGLDCGCDCQFDFTGVCTCPVTSGSCKGDSSGYVLTEGHAVARLQRDLERKIKNAGQTQ